MALSKEDKKDVAGAFGKKAASAVSKATQDHETDWQRRRRQRNDVKKYGITGSTPADAAKRIAEHTSAKSKALKKKTSDGESAFHKAMDKSLHKYDPK